MPVDAHQRAHEEAHGVIRDPVHVGVPRDGVRDPQLPEVETQDSQKGKRAERVSQAQCQKAPQPGGLLIFYYI